MTRSIRDEVGVTPGRWRDHAALRVAPDGAAFAVTGAPHVPAVRAVHAESGRQATGAHA